ncbi:hypothetical protein CEXT_582511 [Caerostris extrusa]|uniref:Uncharacterized protein n=1 Tax=Caerostris extrusa TaxID=172846 RepID=A0AAV4SKT4_CAEEX|nr:hypothetical protein CEXT_582511 [Caerostris extrusa]
MYSANNLRESQRIMDLFRLTGPNGTNPGAAPAPTPGLPTSSTFIDMHSTKIEGNLDESRDPLNGTNTGAVPEPTPGQPVKLPKQVKYLGSIVFSKLREAVVRA